MTIKQKSKMPTLRLTPFLLLQGNKLKQLRELINNIGDKDIIDIQLTEYGKNRFFIHNPIIEINKKIDIKKEIIDGITFISLS